MFKKILPVLLIALVWPTALALAEDGRRSARDRVPQAGKPVYQSAGTQSQCYSGLNGRGKVVQWAESREMCRNQANGQSWGYNGHFENFYRKDPPAGNPIYQQRGAQAKCYTGQNGRGKVIEWAKSKEQCRNQTTGQSWGHSGHYDNFLGRTDFRR